MGQPTRLCAHCGMPLGAEKRRNATFCGRACKDAARRAVSRSALRDAKAVVPRFCKICNEDITFRRSDAETCGIRCSRKVVRLRAQARKDREREMPSCRFCGTQLTDRRGKVCFAPDCRTKYGREIYFRTRGLDVPSPKCLFCGRELSNASAKICNDVACRRAHAREYEKRRVAALTGPALAKFKLAKANDAHRRRLAKATDDSRPVSGRDWRRLVMRYEGRCAYCGERGDLTMDHVIPLSRGGRHAIGNVLPACWSCNCSKRQRLLVEWRQKGR